MKPIIWTIKDIANILSNRQNNEFDGNFVVTGDRGNGKSTLISKIFYRFPNFRPWKHQVYTREGIIKILKTLTRSPCFDDEAINSGYKRDFQSKAQQELIKIITAFRDNYNIYASAIPNFFSLDKDLRDLVFLHLHVVERGLAVVHTPIRSLLYSQDKWDTKNNAKIEQSWTKKIKKDPNFKPKYNRLSTFRGFLYFNDMTKKQKEIYKEVKITKRKTAFTTEEESKEDSFYERIYKLLIDKKLTRSGLLQYSLFEGKKYNTILSRLNNMLTDNGIEETASHFFKDTKQAIHNSSTEEINDLVPHPSSHFV